MNKSKIAITISPDILSSLDELVTQHIFPNRSKAFEIALKEKINRMNKSRLTRECLKLNPAFEKELAEEGMSEELSEWPEY